MYIRLKIAVCAILLSATMFSCTKEEMVAEPLRKGPEIGFGVNLGWEADKIGTKSGYGKKQGEFVLRSSELEDTLAVGVYVQNGINLNEEPKTKGAVTSSENLDKFGVWCQLTNGNNESISYFSNLEVSRDLSSGVCSSDTYYWPGSDFTKLEFLAVGPYAPEGLTPDNTILPTSFTYTVPEEAVDQTDIIIATPKYSTESAAYPGNYDTQINLNFNHILSAVNVKVGSIPAGTINSIIISGVAKGGKYSVGGNTWSNFVAQEDDESFAVDFGENDKYATTGNETGNPQINAANATFMMVPQNLSESAELIVNFTHEATGRTYDLKASLKDQQWLMGNTHNYLINITPDYIIEIVEEEVPIADCHYDVREITISDDQNVGWTLSSNVDWVKFRVKPADYETNEYKDYWIENHRVVTIDRVVDLYRDENASDNRSSEKTTTVDNRISNTIQGQGTKKVIIYFYENIGTSSDNDFRFASMSVTNLKGVEMDKIDVTQYFPKWVNGKALERIEEDIDGYIWGFSSNRTVTYSYPNVEEINWGSLQWLWNAIVIANRYGLDFLGLYDYFLGDRKAARGEAYKAFYDAYILGQTNGFAVISPQGGNGTVEWGENNPWSVKLDYSKLSNISTTSENGLTNTVTILNYVGASDGSDAETWLENNHMVKGAESGTNAESTILSNTAAYQAVKKNSFTAITTIINTTTYMKHPTQGTEQKLDETNSTNAVQLLESVAWYLPSREEFDILNETADVKLDGAYWTSTSLTGGSNSYYFNNGAIVSDLRINKHKVRAARSKN